MGERQKDPITEQRIEARNQARQLYDGFGDAFYKKIYPSVMRPSFRAADDGELDTLSDKFQEALNFLQNRKQGDKIIPGLTRCVNIYCNLRKKAVSYDDETDMNFITKEELMDLKVVIKQILSALKERCVTEGISVLTREEDILDRLPRILVHLYNLARKMCNAISTVARALQKLRESIRCRSKREQCTIMNTYLESTGRASLKSLFEGITSITSISPNNVTFSEKISKAIENRLCKIRKSRLANDYLKAGGFTFTISSESKKYSNSEYYEFGKDFGSWLGLREIRKTVINFKSTLGLNYSLPKCSLSPNSLWDHIAALISDLETPTLFTSWNLDLLKHDLYEFTPGLKEAEERGEAKLTTETKQQLCMAMCLFLGMACTTKVHGFIQALHEGLQLLKEHSKEFYKVFFSKLLSCKHCFTNAIESLLTLTEDGIFQDVLRNRNEASRIEGCLSGLKRYFKKNPGLIFFRAYIQKLHDRAQYYYDKGFVASRYSICFA